jgi:hypothetical protein
MLALITIATIIFLILALAFLCIPKWFPKSVERFENFLNVPDADLYQPPNDSSSDNKPVDIQYQVPIAANQLTDVQLQNLDTDVLRNVRRQVNFSLTDEFTFHQMYNFIKRFRNQSYNFTFNPDNTTKKSRILESEKLIELNTGAINNVNLELFSRLKLELISALNSMIISSGYFLPFHSYQFFKIINSNLISYSSIPTPTTTTNPSIDNYVFTITIAREFKYQQFILYWDIDLIKQSIGQEYTIRINKLELIGMPIPKTIEFHDNRKTTDKNANNVESSDIYKVIKNKEAEEQNQQQKLDIFRDQVSDSQTWDVQPVGNGKIFQSPNTKFIDITETHDIEPAFFDANSASAMVENKIMNIARDQQFKNHRCYGLVNGVSQELVEYNDNPIFCKSYHPEVSQNGIWDAPCQVNSDCPFYKANKNYPNEFGKCDKVSGQCEMPLGVIPIGFTQYGKIEPQCYNCPIVNNGIDNGNDNRCCGIQANQVANGSAKLKSPDYIFSGDELMRRQFTNELLENGLNVNPSI